MAQPYGKQPFSLLAKLESDEVVAGQDGEGPRLIVVCRRAPKVLVVGLQCP